MVQIVGKYEHVSNTPDFPKYLKAMGAPEGLLDTLVNSKPTITISGAGEDWSFHVINAGKESNVSFKLGVPFDDVLPHGLVVKSVAKRDGDKFIMESTGPDGKQGVRVYEFTDAGITVHLGKSKDDTKPTRTYKRL